jgi:hypothetical protein
MPRPPPTDTAKQSPGYRKQVPDTCSIRARLAVGCSAGTAGTSATLATDTRTGEVALVT